MKPYITINHRRIGKGYPPYIVAEMSANHNGDINRAYQIMEVAKNAGADAIKIQSYTADTMTIDCQRDDFKITQGLWKGQTLYQLYQSAHMPWDWHPLLFKRAKELNLTILSSPFDFSAVDLLEELHTPAYKIASFELIDLPLIKRIAQTGKPILMSTGMANEQEIKEAIDMAKMNGCEDIIVLHCVSSYPALSKDYNLQTIIDMRQKYNVLTGLSDHTIDNTTAIASVALGACLIEKHVTLDRNGGGVDDSFSLEPDDLTNLCKHAYIAWQALGKENDSSRLSENKNLIFRRSLYLVKNIKKGEIFTHEHVRSIRPGFGIPPKFLDEIIGCPALQDLTFGTPIAFQHYK